MVLNLNGSALEFGQVVSFRYAESGEGFDWYRAGNSLRPLEPHRILPTMLCAMRSASVGRTLPSLWLGWRIIELESDFVKEVQWRNSI
jgi:hypothetical protein